MGLFLCLIASSTLNFSRNVLSFLFLCFFFPDIITFDFSKRLDFRLKHATLTSGIQRGIFFEINVSPALKANGKGDLREREGEGGEERGEGRKKDGEERKEKGREEEGSERDRTGEQKKNDRTETKDRA